VLIRGILGRQRSGHEEGYLLGYRAVQCLKVNRRFRGIYFHPSFIPAPQWFLDWLIHQLRSLWRIAPVVSFLTFVSLHGIICQKREREREREELPYSMSSFKEFPLPNTGGTTQTARVSFPVYLIKF
jgi:23S rRNA C2498 (ribose-2'-O)-methylase RlmM